MTCDMADETNDQAPETPAEQAPQPAAPVQDATPAPAGPAAAEPAAPAAEAVEPAVEPVAAEPVAAEFSPAADAPTAEAASSGAGDGAGDAPAPAPDAPAPGDGPAGDKPKRRRSRGGGGNKVAKAWGVKAANVDGVPAIDLTPTGEGVPAGASQQRRQGGGQSGKGGSQGGKGGGPRKGGGDRPQSGGRPQRPPREKGPLPFDELREAARTIVEIHGKRTALKDAFGALAQKERDQLSEIVASDGDFRVRARAISAGSLSAGKIGKALAAQQIAIADVQDLWALTLSKEDAAERQSYIRNAKRRDEERAKKQAERRNSADRISKEDMHKARDGHVTASIRMDPAILAAFGGGGADTEATPVPEAAPATEVPKKDKKKQGSSVLDRLGY